MGASVGTKIYWAIMESHRKEDAEDHMVETIRQIIVEDLAVDMETEDVGYKEDADNLYAKEDVVSSNLAHTNKEDVDNKDADHKDAAHKDTANKDAADKDTASKDAAN